MASDEPTTPTVADKRKDDLNVYWGVASGSSHAAFRRHYEGHPEYQDAPTPSRLMINWRTHNNQVWAAPPDAPSAAGTPANRVYVRQRLCREQHLREW